MPSFNIQPKDQQQLIKLARQVIETGAELGHQPDMNTDDYPDYLKQPGACFVSLHISCQLRGCIGSLTAYQPLIDDIIQRAYSAAFHDPRFPPITTEEAKQLDIEISVLTPQTAIDCDTEQELLNTLVPHQDGLTIEAGTHKATFLPVVWEQLPDKQDFLDQLRLKAGLAKNYWSSDVKAFRYHTISFKG